MSANLKVVSTTTGNANTVVGIVQSIANKITPSDHTSRGGPALLVPRNTSGAR